MLSKSSSVESKEQVQAEQPLRAGVTRPAASATCPSAFDLKQAHGNLNPEPEPRYGSVELAATLSARRLPWFPIYLRVCHEDSDFQGGKHLWCIDESRLCSGLPEDSEASDLAHGESSTFERVHRV